MIYILIFTAAMMIKGGWLARVPTWKQWEANRATILKKGKAPATKYFLTVFADALLDEKNLSTFVVFAGLAAAQPDLWFAASVSLAWALACRVSMGEEAGGIGDWEYNTGDYVELYGPAKGRITAVKRGFQYGALFGGLLALVSGNVWLVLAGLSFPLVYFIGNYVYRMAHKTSSWAYSEILWGATFGLVWWLG
jgi:hypothetical protein